MQSEIDLCASAATIKVKYDGKKVVVAILTGSRETSMALELHPHEFVEITEALRGVANSMRQDAMDFYHIRDEQRRLRMMMESAPEIGKSLQAGIEPEEPWQKSLRPDEPPPKKE